MRVNDHLLYCYILLLTGVLACSSSREPRTPREFVERYSQAWKSGDVDAILAMRSRKPLVEVDLRPEMKKELEEASLADEKDEIGQSIKRRDFAYVSWSNTEFDSAEDHQGHVHVSVRVSGVPSTIVLVREGEMLKIHPRPSSFQ